MTGLMRRLAVVLALLGLVTLAACARAPGRQVPIQSGGMPVGVYAFGDSDPHDWRSGNPYGLPVHGIDISRYQGRIDWGTVRASGVAFAFIKATEGGDYADPAFPTYWAQAGAAGLPRSAYHYFYMCRSGAEQAAWFIRNVPRGRALPHVLDLEWTRSATCRTRPPASWVLREAGIFLQIVGQHYGQRPIVYTTVDFYRDNGLGRLNAQFWLRSVADHPRVTYPGQRWTFWQYTGTGIVPGIRGNVDLNAFAGTRAQWQQWLATHWR